MLNVTDPLYNRAGPSLLAKQDPDPAPPPVMSEWPVLWGKLESRLNVLYNWRLSWWQHWGYLARYILPRRYHWVVTANTQNRGLPINQDIVDPTGTLAMQKCAGGMMSGLTSPSRPWFKLRPRSPNSLLDHESAVWIDEVESLIYDTLARSNFYDSMTQMYEDLVVFGTAPMILYEDDTHVIKCYNPCAGEYFLATDSSFRVTSLFRKFTMTIMQIVDMFGAENIPPTIRALWAQKGNSLETEYIVAHAIEPNYQVEQSSSLWPKKFVFREAYWLWGIAAEAPLSVGGYDDPPFIAPRWATTSNDAYGRSPGMVAMYDIMQLQVMTRRKAEAIEKQVRPPLLASTELKNEPSSIAPGHVTYVSNLGPQSGMRPIYEVKPELAYMTADMQQIQIRIKEEFFNDLFLMIEQTDPAKRMTATEVTARQQEKLQMLGPVIERVQHEGLAPALNRVFAIMTRRGLFPPMPEALKAQPLQIEFVSMLSQAQKASATIGMEQLLTVAGSIAQVNPEVLDNFNADEFLRTYAGMTLVPQKILNSADQVAKTRQARAKAQQQKAAQESAVGMVAGATDVAKSLSETQIGGGQTALQAMISGIPPGAMQ